jgi:hypothetical protein
MGLVIVPCEYNLTASGTLRAFRGPLHLLREEEASADIGESQVLQHPGAQDRTESSLPHRSPQVILNRHTSLIGVRRESQASWASELP